MKSNGIERVTQQELIGALQEQSITEAALELTWRGKDGWGDCGQATWMMVSETSSGESYVSHRFFEEEVIHWLRHALPLKREKLGVLPDEIDLIKLANIQDIRDIDEEAARSKKHFTAFALHKAGLLMDVDGKLEVGPAMYAAACFNSADIRNPDDRFAASLLDGVDVDKEVRKIRLYPMGADSSDEYEKWWNMQQANLERVREGNER